MESADTSQNLRENWMSWLALRHLLPTHQRLTLAREICADTQIATFDELFEQAECASPNWSDGLLLFPKPTNGAQSAMLQEALFSAFSKSDNSSIYGFTSAEARLLTCALELGSADLDNIHDVLNNGDWTAFEQKSFSKLAQSILHTSRDRSSKDTVLHTLSTLQELPSPLNAASVKHTGDLLADADEWESAASAYELSAKLLSEVPDSWASASWAALFDHSHAAALYRTEGSEAATAKLSTIVFENQVPDPLTRANSESDLRFLRRRAPGRAPRFIHASAPLLQSSYEISRPLMHAAVGQDSDADRWSWAILRRLTAIGSLGKAQEMRAIFALQIVNRDRISSTRDDDRRLKLAARLLVEAGSPSLAKSAKWNASTTRSILDEPTITDLVNRALRYNGVKLERTETLAQLLAENICAAEFHNTKPIFLAWQWIAKTTAGLLEEDIHEPFERRDEVAQKLLSLLDSLGCTSPELRSGVQESVFTAALAGLGSERWRTAAAAAKVANTYSDALPPENLKTLAEQTCEQAERLEPTVELWPLIRPCLTFLTSDAVAQVAKLHRELGHRILTQIIRFGTEQESEHSRLFFYLRNFDPKLLESTELRNRVEVAVSAVVEDTAQVNSSRITESASALLLAPEFSGADATRAALESTCRVLELAAGGEFSMGIARIHDPLFLLVSSLDTIRQLLGPLLDDFIEKISQLVAGVWRKASETPSILAPFSIPEPTDASKVVVHNFTVASLEIGAASNSPEILKIALEEAEKSPSLASGIKLGRLTYSRGSAEGPAVAEDIERSTGPEFYDSLGRWVSQSASDPNMEISQILLDQVLRFGPRDADAAVFVHGIAMNLHVRRDKDETRNYLSRLENKPEATRHLLSPLLKELATRGESPPDSED